MDVEGKSDGNRREIDGKSDEHRLNCHTGKPNGEPIRPIDFSGFESQLIKEPK